MELKRKKKAYLRSIQGKPLKDLKNLNQRKSEVSMIVPKNFSFLGNPEEVTSFIGKLEQILKKSRSVFINMENIEIIDHAAISSLLCVMYLFKTSKIGFNGNFPKDQNISKIIRESGFLYHLFENPQNITKYKIGVDNQLLTQSHSILDPNMVKDVIEDTSHTVWGDSRDCPGLYRVIIELIDNTHAHASKKYKGSERWWLSINHDKINNKVSYIFIDYGIGVFTSILNKPKEDPIGQFLNRMQTKIGLDKNGEYLKSLLTTQIDRKKMSGKKGRGWGIYGINQTMIRNQISNLSIITNNAFGDVVKDEYKRLETGFNGTLYYWEICYNNKSIIRVKKS